MEQNDIFIEKQGAIATMFLNRPEKRNALNLNMWKLIPIRLKELEEDKEVKVLIIRGRDDTAFAAGADIGEFQTLRMNPENARDYDYHVEEAETSLNQFSKPIIAMIQNFCIGGGCEIALACDLRFTSENGIFGITPSKLGLIYGVSATKNLVDTVGPSKAKDILFSGRFLNATEAYHIGLVDQVFPDDDIIEKTYEYARLVANRAQKTVKGSKKVVRYLLEDSSIQLNDIYSMMNDAIQSNDYKEGISAFLEKRKPNFKDI